MKNLKNYDFDEDATFSSKPTKRVKKFELNIPTVHQKTQRLRDTFKEDGIDENN